MTVPMLTGWLRPMILVPASALIGLRPEALEALKRAEVNHPLHSIRMVAREALWRRDIAPLPREPSPPMCRTRLTHTLLRHRKT